MKYKPLCIKCRKRYDSDEPDDYYCADCEAQKNSIAKEVDAKIASRTSTRERVSELQQFDNIRKEKGVNFVNIKDLGITL